MVRRSRLAQELKIRGMYFPLFAFTPRMKQPFAHLKQLLIIKTIKMKNLNLKELPVKTVKKFYTTKGFKEEVREDNGDINMSRNCSFTAEYFAPAKGSGVTKATEPTWLETDNGKFYCIVMGYAKVKNMSKVGDTLQRCILNKKSYDNGDFELGTMYSAVCHVPILDAEGERHEEFNQIFFTVFENEGTNNDM